MIGAVIAAAQAGLLGLGHGGNGQHGPQYGGYNYNGAHGMPALSGAYPGQFAHPGLLQQANSLAFNSPLGQGNQAGVLGHGTPLGHASTLNHPPYPGAQNGLVGPFGHGNAFGHAISHVDRTDFIQAYPIGHANAGHLAHPAALAQQAALSPALNLAHNAHTQVSNVIHPSPVHPGLLSHAAPLGHVGPLAHAGSFAHTPTLEHAAPLPYPAAGALAHPAPLAHNSPLAPVTSLANSPVAHPASFSNSIGSYGYARQYAGAENYHVCIVSNQLLFYS